MASVEKLLFDWVRKKLCLSHKAGSFTKEVTRRIKAEVLRFLSKKVVHVGDCEHDAPGRYGERTRKLMPLTSVYLLFKDSIWF